MVMFVTYLFFVVDNIPILYLKYRFAPICEVTKKKDY